MRRVLHLITGLGVGGAERVMVRVALSMRESGWEPVVVSLGGDGPMSAPLRAAGVPVHHLDMRPARPSLAAMWRLVRLIRRHRPDLVQTWMYHADLFGAVTSRLVGGPPVVWNLRQSDLSPALNRRVTLAIARACARLSGRLPHSIVACSRSARDAHVAFGYDGDRMTVIRNGFDTDEFRPREEARAALRAELRIDPDATVVGWVGRYHRQKDPENLIGAACRVAMRREGVHFVLCGSGLTDDNEALTAPLREAGLGSRVTLLGRRDDVPRVLSAFDLFVSPSRGEGFPNAVGEAMACGVPCVVTDVGDSAELVGEGGRVVPPKDPALLAAGIEEVLDLSPSERRSMAARARRRIEAHFSLGATTARYGRLYERVVGDAAPGGDSTTVTGGS